MDTGLLGVVTLEGERAACSLGCVGAGHSASHWLTQNWGMLRLCMRTCATISPKPYASYNQISAPQKNQVYLVDQDPSRRLR